MSYLLGAITLKNPAGFTREYFNTEAVQRSLTGRSTKDIRNRKERFILRLQNLTQAQVTAINGEYDLQTTRNFEVTETNQTVAATPVHIDIVSRSFTGGEDYRENMTLILTEVT